jgi:hypothetical protein
LYVAITPRRSALFPDSPFEGLRLESDTAAFDAADRDSFPVDRLGGRHLVVGFAGGSSQIWATATHAAPDSRAASVIESGRSQAACYPARG